MLLDLIGIVSIGLIFVIINCVLTGIMIAVMKRGANVTDDKAWIDGQLTVMIIDSFIIAYLICKLL